MTSFIHPTATVEDGASLGDGSKVWHHCHVMSGARVGAGTSLGKDVFIGGAAIVGDRVKVQNGVSVYDGVVLEDDVFVGPHAIFTNVDNPRAFVDRRGELRPTRVERGATIGAGAVIVCGHTIGAYAFVGAGAVVTRDVEPHALVVGNPARRIGWMSRAGHRLPGGDDVVCPGTHERYTIDARGCRPSEGTAGPAHQPIPLQDIAAETHFFEPKLRRAFDRVLASGAFILGDEVKQLERAMSELLHVEHAVGVSSGTDALLVSLMALGIGPGDEVITTPLSFFATASVILRVGAKPVFADIDLATQNIDPSCVRAAITPRTRAILPVHLFGRPVDLEVFDLAREHGIPVIEDAAQAIGATTERGHVGGLGTLGCFSFFPTKNLGGLGDGGLVVTNDAKFADRVRLLRTQGAKPKYHHLAVGGNFRLDALQAAFLREKLPYLEELNERRRVTARAYSEAFAELEHRGVLHLPAAHPGHVWHQYVIRSPKRDELRAQLAAAGIETAIYYPEPLHRMPAAIGTIGEEPRELVGAEQVCRENLALPVGPWAGLSAVRRVVDSVRAFGDTKQVPSVPDEG